MSTPSTTCAPPPLDVVITGLEDDLKKQDTADAKGHLAAAKKISDEVAQAEAKYAKGYEALLVDYQQSKNYEDVFRKKLETAVSEADRKRIAEIANCYDDDLGKLKKKWDDARDKLPGLQKTYSETQKKFVDDEVPYREALKFRAKQDDLDALERQIEQNVEAQNLRAAYFLLTNMQPLNEPVKAQAYSTDLRGKAATFEIADHAQRVAKTALDLGLDEAQKAKKAYDDAKAKRRENLLKQIAEEPFPPPPPKNPSPTDREDESGEAATDQQGG
jgi:hypothetical protein